MKPKQCRTEYQKVGESGRRKRKNHKRFPIPNFRTKAELRGHANKAHEIEIPNAQVAAISIACTVKYAEKGPPISAL